MGRLRIALSSAVVGVSLAVLFIAPDVVFAEPEWMANGALTAEVFDDYASEYKHTNYAWIYRMPHCEYATGQVVDTSTGSGSTRDLCVYKGKNVTIAGYRQVAWGAPKYAIKLPSSSSYYELMMPQNISQLAVSPSASTLLVRYAQGFPYDESKIHVYANVADAVVVDTRKPSGSVESYRLRQTVAKTWVDYRDEDGIIAYPGITRTALSSNGRYLAAGTYGGLVKVDMISGQRSYIANSNYLEDFSPLAISNDGRYIASEQGRLFDTKGCGDAYGHAQFSGSTSYQTLYPCRESNWMLPLWQASLEVLGRGGADFRFADDNRWLSFSTHEDPWNQDSSWPSEKADTIGVVIYAADTADITKRLDYMALGDSYSSGEGDIGRKTNGGSYYLSGTAGKNECHVSSRSYPFLLRTAWGISESKMKSVACSGAQVKPDMNGSPKGYLGQESRLKHVDDPTNVKLDALDTFRPGIVQQIEFVRKYQPKVITLTGGGNDIGFAKILSYCAVLESTGTCDHAKENSSLNRSLYDAIDSQYGRNRKLIRDIQRLSPYTKIILIGYPSFINDRLVDCPTTAGLLNVTERRFINKMVSRVNSMLQRVAYDAGIQYVNVEQSLYGGRMCDGGKYMTDVWDKGVKRRATEQEWFHPNADGHKRIANTIIASGAYTSNTTPQPGNYVPQPQYTDTSAEKIIPQNILLKNSSTKTGINPGLLQSGSSYGVRGYSDPVDLGTFTANPDGSADAEISLVGLSPGKHMLELNGIGPDGQPVRYYQFIEIHESLDDADGDGIPNSVDKCNFIEHWYDEDAGGDLCATTVDEMKSSDDPAVQAYLKSKGIMAKESDLVSSGASSNQTPTEDGRQVTRAQDLKQRIHLWLFGILGVVVVIVGMIVLKWRK